MKNLNKSTLPKGVRFNKGAYEARATVNGTKVYFRNQDLDKLLVEFEAAKAVANRENNMRTGDITLNEWFHEWMTTVKSQFVKPHSVPAMIRAYNRSFGFYVGGMKIKDINALDLQDAVNTSKQNVALSTIKSSFANVKESLEYACAAHMIAYNPSNVVEVPSPYKRKKREIPLTKQEQIEFLSTLQDNSSWYTEMFFIMFLTGMRVGEIGGLSWSDIDFEKKEIHVTHSLTCIYVDGEKQEFLTSPKTSNSYRTIPFVGECEEMLKRQRVKIRELKESMASRDREIPVDADPVFVTTRYSYCTRYTAAREINSIVAQINQQRALRTLNDKDYVFQPFPHVHPHLIRHTFATRCFEAGMDPKTVQELMGHSSITITMDIYTHVMEDKMKAEVTKLGNAALEDRKVEEKKGIQMPDITAL